jgi:hypothetical protein
VAYPESHADFYALVVSMRSLGVVQAFGIVLGPPPPKVAVLEKAAADAPPEERSRLNLELAEEKRRIRLEELRESMRLDLASTGRSYSDSEIDRLIGPEAMELQ